MNKTTQTKRTRKAYDRNPITREASNRQKLRDFLELYHSKDNQFKIFSILENR